MFSPLWQKKGTYGRDGGALLRIPNGNGQRAVYAWGRAFFIGPTANWLPRYWKQSQFHQEIRTFSLPSSFSVSSSSWVNYISDRFFARRRWSARKYRCEIFIVVTKENIPKREKISGEYPANVIFDFFQWRDLTGRSRYKRNSLGTAKIIENGIFFIPSTRIPFNIRRIIIALLKSVTYERESRR